MQSSSVRRNALWASAAAAALALVVHTYLAVVHYGVEYGTSTGERLCNVGESFNCEAVSASKYAEFLGLPLAVLGFAVNLGFLALLAAHAMSQGSTKKANAVAALATSTTIFGASVAMGLVSLLFMSKYCLFCMFAYALSAIGLAFSWIGLKSDAFSDNFDLPAAFKPIALTFVASAVFALAANGVAKKAYGGRDVGPIVASSVADWIGSPTAKVIPHEPLIKGAAPEAARLTLVEFADYRCIHCKHAAPTLEAFVSARPDVRLSFQPWPLDGACNPKISSASGASCALARASFCASKSNDASGKPAGWAAHKWLYDNLERMTTIEATETAIADMASQLHLDASAFSACVAGEEAKKAVLRQSEVGNELDLAGTPTIYANGRRLPNGQLMQVLKAAYEKADLAPNPN